MPSLPGTRKREDVDAAQHLGVVGAAVAREDDAVARCRGAAPAPRRARARRVPRPTTRRRARGSRAKSAAAASSSRSKRRWGWTRATIPTTRSPGAEAEGGAQRRIRRARREALDVDRPEPAPRRAPAAERAAALGDARRDAVQAVGPGPEQPAAPGRGGNRLSLAPEAHQRRAARARPARPAARSASAWSRVWKAWSTSKPSASRRARRRRASPASRSEPHARVPGPRPRRGASPGRAPRRRRSARRARGPRGTPAPPRGRARAARPPARAWARPGRSTSSRPSAAGPGAARRSPAQALHREDALDPLDLLHHRRRACARPRPRGRSSGWRCGRRGWRRAPRRC